jgi:exosortase
MALGIDVSSTGKNERPASAVSAAGNRLSGIEWALVALVTVVLVPAWVALSRVWDDVDYYSHGYMVPLVALWAASAQRGVLPTLPAARDARGIGVIAAALVLYFIGMTASLVGLAGLSIPVAVAGLVLFLRGAAWLRALSFGIGYLLFMVPLPPALLTPIIVKLQLFVSVAGVGLLQAAGHAIHREGNLIHLPDGETLFVAEACSGITSIVTLVPLGVFLAYFTERRWAFRTLLVATVIPVAMLGNLVRVVISVIAAEQIGAEAATQSAFHDWVGLSTYVAACLVLLGIGRWIRKLWPEVPLAAPG